MKFLITLFLTVFLTGCTFLLNKPEKTFESGKYWVEFEIQKPSQCKYTNYWNFENNNGYISVKDPSTGNKIFSAQIKGNAFSSLKSYVSKTNYKGTLIKNNFIEGVFKEKLSNTLGGKKEKTEILGSFVITPSNTPISPKEILSFLPIATYGKPIKSADPRAISIVIDKYGIIYDAKIEQAHRSYVRWIKSKKRLDKKQIVEIIKSAIQKYGKDIPIYIYADKNTNLFACNIFFEICKEMGFLRLRGVALPHILEGPLMFNINLLNEDESSKINEKDLIVTIFKKKFILKDKTFSKEELKRYLNKIAANSKEQLILIEYSKDANMQNLISFLNISNELGLERVKLISNYKSKISSEIKN